MTAINPLLPPDEGGTHAAVLDVACLCAGWCRTCDEYASVFRQLQQAQPGHRYRWIDIEDEAELIGDVDVETFPTLLLAHEGQVLFAGPVLPRLGDAQRLMQVSGELLMQGETAPAASSHLPQDQAGAFKALAERLAGPHKARAA